MQKQQTPIDTRLRTDTRLIVLQSRLFAPNYAGPGRWVIFHPGTRRSFLAVGGAKYSRESARRLAAPRVGGNEDTWPSWMEGVQHQDIVPDVIRVLMAASEEALTGDQMARRGLVDSPERLAKLAAAGLLHPASESYETGMSTFVARYHLSAFDYPFNDYSDPQWFQKDAATMRRYLELSPQPPGTANRKGRSIPLPAVSHDADSVVPDHTLTLTALATILKWTFAPIGDIKIPVVGPLLRKTSPSGGGRHPTEVMVLLGEPLEQVSAGAYYYDVNRHALVEVPASDKHDLPQVEGGCALLVCSMVERAMWRYREFRSFRPVVLDAGHIAETLSLVAGLYGQHTSVEWPHLTYRPGRDGLSEPPFALVALGNAKVRPPEKRPEPVEQGSVLTNPALYLTFRNGGLDALPVWPSLSGTSLDILDFQVLGHCTPSSRGDRDTTVAGISEAFPEWDINRFDLLCNAGVLLPGDLARAFYAEARPWAVHGWYLSLLAHLEIHTAQAMSPRQPAVHRSISKLDSLESGDLLRAMLARRTTRAFEDRAISRSMLETLLRDALEQAEEALPALEVLVAPLAVEDLESGVHVWRDGRFAGFRETSIGRKDVQSMTIGQEPISRAAAVVWLVARADCDSPADYELSMVGLGRLGQRLCLRATHAGLGIFLTPAVCDQATYEKLGVSDPVSRIAYAFGIGHARE